MASHLFGFMHDHENMAHLYNNNFKKENNYKKKENTYKDAASSSIRALLSLKKLTKIIAHLSEVHADLSSQIHELLHRIPVHDMRKRVEVREAQPLIHAYKSGV